MADQQEKIPCREPYLNKSLRCYIQCNSTPISKKKRFSTSFSGSCSGAINQMKMLHANSYVVCYELLQNIKQWCNHSHKTSLLMVLQDLSVLTVSSQNSRREKHASYQWPYISGLVAQKLNSLPSLHLGFSLQFLIQDEEKRLNIWI